MPSRVVVRAEEAVVVATMRVLIADDNDLVRSALRELIESDERFRVVALADSADTAVVEARKTQPDLAVVDVRMPGGGPKAVRGILEVSAGTRVLACSAYDDAFSRDEMAASGVVAYLVKGRDDVIVALQRVCGLID
ncbi:MAG TPA: response regulator transcription factor [Acidimicrobiia bacterium]|nr:response regulator transcription factor [Acidimicrobiia bacterium]